MTRLGRAMCLSVAAMLLATGCGQQPEPPVVDAAYAAEIDQWHSDRVARLAEPTDWLSVVGLHWISEGPNSFGTAEINDVVLPMSAGAEHGGIITLGDDEITVKAASGVELLLNEHPWKSSRNK